MIKDSAFPYSFLARLEKAKELQKTTGKKDLNLLAYEFIERCVRLSKICDVLNLNL
ncbi:hypothetical protein GW923_04035 [Candidatus Pacearchaeota archaeon]|nr:hypothetical protein [Candidatus Pacearchaeota archaeon]